MSPAPEVQQLVLQPGDRRVTLALPAGHAGERPLPLVVALHYAGHGAPFYGRGVLEGLVEPALRDLGAVIAAPDCTGSDWTGPRSEAGVLALLDHLQKTVPVDPRRTLVTGYSMGGHGAWHLAGRYPDRFAAALVMAAWPPPAALAGGWRTPLYVIHSRQDEVVPLAATERAVRELQARGAAVELVVVERTGHYETHRFVAPLRAAVPWIERLWTEPGRMEETGGGTGC
jgi:predicted peptidase